MVSVRSEHALGLASSRHGSFSFRRRGETSAASTLPRPDMNGASRLASNGASASAKRSTSLRLSSVVSAARTGKWPVLAASGLIAQTSLTRQPRDADQARTVTRLPRADAIVRLRRQAGDSWRAYAGVPLITLLG